jgi:hypothetical protein
MATDGKASIRGRESSGRFFTCRPFSWKIRCTVFLLKFCRCAMALPFIAAANGCGGLIEVYGKSKVIRMDSDPGMTPAKLVSWAEWSGNEPRYVQPGKPNQNAFVERFNHRARHEVLNTWLFESLSQAQQILERWRVEYKTVRSHESADKKTPLAFLPRVVNAEISTYECLPDREV